MRLFGFWPKRRIFILQNASSLCKIENRNTTPGLCRGGQERSNVVLGTQQLFWLGLAAGIVALLFAIFQAKRVLSFSEGNDAMKKIASAIREGANAYLRHQYATVFKVFAVEIGRAHV